MVAREPSEAKKSAAAAKRADAAAIAAAPESNGMGITFEEMQTGYEQQIGGMSSIIVQQNIIIGRLQAELTQKKETP